MKSTHIVPQAYKISKKDRIKQLHQKPLIVWFTGYSGSGKSTTLAAMIDLLNQNGSMNIDSICNTITLPVSKVSSTLLNLEFKGVLKSLPGKMYELI